MYHPISNQPPAFRMIFLLEIWERFGFYTMQGLFTVYFIRYLGYTELESYYTFGAFSALVYGLVVLGGYLGDKILGTKRCIILGLITLALGYFFLSIADKKYVFYALGVICVGNGLFKANPSSLLAKCYEPNDSRIHQGFTLYYMAINLGSTIALILGPWLASHYGYFYAFFSSTIGLLLGLLNYNLQKHFVANINTHADLQNISGFQWMIIIFGVVFLSLSCATLLHYFVMVEYLLSLIVIITLAIYFYLANKESKEARIRMWVAMVLIVEALIFFTLYQQMPTSMNLYAVNNVKAQILGWSFDPQSFQALNPIWIIVLSPVLAAIYLQLTKKNIVFSIAHKFALGMSCCAISFFVLYLSRYASLANGMVAPWWLIISYVFQSLGELLISALGVAMVAELVPSHCSGFVMGMWFLSSSAAGFTGAVVASYTAMPENIKPGINSLLIYTKVFGWMSLVVALIALLMWITAPLLNRYILLPDTNKKVRSG